MLSWDPGTHFPSLTFASLFSQPHSWAPAIEKNVFLKLRKRWLIAGLQPFLQECQGPGEGRQQVRALYHASWRPSDTPPMLARRPLTGVLSAGCSWPTKGCSWKGTELWVNGLTPWKVSCRLGDTRSTNTAMLLTLNLSLLCERWTQVMLATLGAATAAGGPGVGLVPSPPLAFPVPPSYLCPWHDE